MTVYKLDRFSRNKFESVVNRRKLADNGVKLLSAMENITDSTEGIILESLLEGFKRSNGHNKSKLQSKQPIQCKTDKYSSNKQ